MIRQVNFEDIKGAYNEDFINIKQVDAEGVRFMYDKNFTYNELRGTCNIVMETDALQLLSKEDLAPVCRPVISEFAFGDDLYVKYLFWYRESELTEVDRKVDAGLYTDADFYYSITTYFVPGLFCHNCKHYYKGLVVNTDLFYFKNSALERKKVKELIGMGKGVSCPNCGTPFRILAVHLF